MKNRVSLCSQFGLTETEMAMLLGTTRSRWSMYERNRGNLSPEATTKLAELLSLMPVEVHNNQNSLELPELFKKKLSALLEDYQLKSLLLTRKIVHVQEKLDKQKHLFVKFTELKKSKSEKSAVAKKYEAIVGQRFSVDQAVAAEMKIFMLQTKLESLELEMKRVEEKAKELD